MPPVRVVPRSANGALSDFAHFTEEPEKIGNHIWHATSKGRIMCAFLGAIIYLIFAIVAGALYSTTTPTWITSKVRYPNFVTLNNVSAPATNPIQSGLNLQWAFIGTFIAMAIFYAFHIIRVVWTEPIYKEGQDEADAAELTESAPIQSADAGLLMTNVILMPLIAIILMGVLGNDDFAAKFLMWLVVALFYTLIFLFTCLLHSVMNLRNAKMADDQKGVGGYMVGMRESILFGGVFLPMFLLFAIWFLLVWPYQQVINNGGAFNTNQLAALWIFLVSLLLSWLWYVAFCNLALIGLFFKRPTGKEANSDSFEYGAMAVVYKTGTLSKHMLIDNAWPRFVVGMLPYLLQWVTVGVCAFCLLNFYQSNRVGL